MAIGNKFGSLSFTDREGVRLEGHFLSFYVFFDQYFYFVFSVFISKNLKICNVSVIYNCFSFQKMVMALKISIFFLKQKQGGFTCFKIKAVLLINS